MNTLGNKLRSARKAKHLSQIELARLVDTDPSHISRIEKGERTPTLELAKALALALAPHLSAEELLDLGVREARPGYGADDALRRILTDYTAPQGLRELASDHDLIAALRITADEWRALTTCALPANVSKEGYVQLLVTLRAITPKTHGVTGT